ncbi:MAG: N-acetylmuramoyl-L-alanine amidase [Verrucomicrobiae bacterium]|nr:N-acetylmuramoyl-L-alanine amidase [Verrucomicrobiae bacterium]
MRWVFLSLFFVLSFYQPGNAAEWQIIRLENRDYLSLMQVAEFYRLMQPIDSRDKERTLVGGNYTLKFRLDSEEMQINGVKHVLCLPVYQRNGQWLISRMDLVKTLDPILRPSRIEEGKNFNTIILDAGHGGGDQGARSVWSPNEKVLTLDLARRLRGLCEDSGFRVVMTRNDDVLIPLEERANFTRRYNNSIFVSLHFNSGPSHAKGVETYCLSPRGTQSTMSNRLRLADFNQAPGNLHDANNILLASSIQSQLSELRGNPTEIRGVKRARFTVLRAASQPAVLVESGFVSNREDAQKLASSSYRQLLAEKIRRGILDYQMLLRQGTKTRPEKGLALWGGRNLLLAYLSN